MNLFGSLFFYLTLLTALGCGLIAGVFFAFSSFVMKALARISPPEGMAAMQSINIVVINPIFLGVFLGTAVACTVIAICSVVQWQQAGALFLLAGCLFYLVGTFLVTVLCNVPLNNVLAAASASNAEGLSVWSDYLKRWTVWNHVRTIAALAAAGSLIVALMRRSGQM